MKKYDHKTIEAKWRKIWEDEQLYLTPENAKPKNKIYVLPQLPYPSGAGLHMGHAEGYIACDIYARFQRMQGKDVLQVLGWDAFGLPAENYAIKTNIHPRINTDKAITTFREQIKELGISVDWSREVGSHDPDYYKWTQWFFLLMYERGLAYRKKQAVNWCEKDKTVLANEQVIDGRCERCGEEVIQKEMEQWFFRITDYADRLYDDLDKVDWPQESVKRQRDWIGRSEGALVKFQLKGKNKDTGVLEVFTTAHDTIYGATFMALSPEHDAIDTLKSHIANVAEVEEYVKESAHKTELERQQQKEKTGVRLEGVVAVNPMTGKEIPVFVADYILAGYGTGAIMAVPGHDERDAQFAEKYDLPVVHVVQDHDFLSYSGDIKDNRGKYIVRNSEEFNGMSFVDAREAMLKKMVKMNVAEPKTQYRLRDWSISRQRFWGAPIPMVYDPEGNLHPVAEKDLPVILPDDVDFVPTGQSPLTYSREFQSGVEEKYGKGWKREVDTLDTFMCSSWYYFRYIDPHNDKAFASKEALDTWMPVDFYIGGPEHVTGHLLYSRFFTKVLFDAGYVKFDEPFLMHRHQGMVYGSDGRKMSKRWGNVVNPTDVVEKYGADTARVYIMFMGPLEQAKAWNDRGAQGVNRFLTRVHDFQQEHKLKDGEVSSGVNRLIKQVTQDIPKLKFNTLVAEFMKTLNVFEDRPEAVTRKDWETYLILLAPFAPLLAEELWQQLGYDMSIHKQPWPAHKVLLPDSEEVRVAVQVNGRVRDTVLVRVGEGEEGVLRKAQNAPKLRGYLDGKQIAKVVYVEGKILNIVVG